MHENFRKKKDSKINDGYPVEKQCYFNKKYEQAEIQEINLLGKFKYKRHC